MDNQINTKLIYEFYLYLRSVNTSESYQNQNIKALINIAKFLGKDVNFTIISNKEEILSYLNTKIKSKEEDPDGKWMRTWNDYLQRLKYFFKKINANSEVPISVADRYSRRLIHTQILERGLVSEPDS